MITENNFDVGDLVIIIASDAEGLKGVVTFKAQNPPESLFVELEDGHGAWFNKTEMEHQ